MTDYSSQVRKLLLCILFANLSVAAAKWSYGWFIGSVSITADGYHSLFDGTSNVIGLVGIWIAAHPPDKHHPYGHSKYETFATVGIAALLLATGIHIFIDAVEGLRNTHVPRISATSFIVMSVTLACNISIMTYELKRGKDLGSDFLIADAKHTLSDVYVTISVILGLIAVKMGYPKADPIIALFIAGMIGKLGYDILRETSDVLCDRSRIDATRICSEVMQIQGIKECHNVRSRGRANDVHVDLHILVDPCMTIYDAHAAAHQVEDRLKEVFNEISDVVVHIEPVKRREGSGVRSEEKKP